MKKILIAEDHPIVSTSVLQLFRRYLPDTKITEADTFWKVMEVVNSTAIDLIILDIGIAGGYNVQMIEKLVASRPQMRILIFSAYDETTHAIPLIKAGAHGFVSKRASGAELITAVETVLYENKVYLSGEMNDLKIGS